MAETITERVQRGVAVLDERRERMNVDRFDRLTMRDLENGAVRDEIRMALSKADHADRLLAVLVELEEHASRYGGVPRSADKLWARVREVLTEVLGPKYGLSVRFGAE